MLKGICVKCGKALKCYDEFYWSKETTNTINLNL